MTVRGGKGWWWAAGVGLGVVLIGLGVFLLRVGLEDADRWGSVFGLFLSIAGLAVGVSSMVRARRAAESPRLSADDAEVTNQIHGGQFTGMVVQSRDTHAEDLGSSSDRSGTGVTGSGVVSNLIKDGTFGGPVVQGRDRYGVLPPPGNASAQPGEQERER